MSILVQKYLDYELLLSMVRRDFQKLGHLCNQKNMLIQHASNHTIHSKKDTEHTLLEIHEIRHTTTLPTSHFSHHSNKIGKYLTYFDNIELADIRMHTDISWEQIKA